MIAHGGALASPDPRANRWKSVPFGRVPLGSAGRLRHKARAVRNIGDPMTPSRDISRLIEIMAALRTPVTGCPWDLEQNFATIAPYTIEEAYEVVDAITRGDLDDLREELGDLLLQVVYHARMAEEQNAFAFGDVVEAITRKMIRRHPHVFADKNGRLAPVACQGGVGSDQGGGESRTRCAPAAGSRPNTSRCCPASRRASRR